ncbi:hypothetical protein J2S74_000409 [Evansella vedderi]|uniref:GNAT family N-acetyltransferase n=1 Tax=Evansella vedderi TaxID=38282 RepID=A0ABT9ZP71_9BACI|nr:hypothetical protein [Evansella vedderi]MDQ0253037.1 hypothetical protein [Evansella vedderi]
MYLRVETVGELNCFNQIWMDCWLEKGYMLEPSSDNGDQFIIQNLEKENIGTIEFKPYYPSIENNINKVFPFHKIEHLANAPEKVIEIDKVAILRKHRGKNLETLLSLFVSYTEHYKKEYSLALLERVFYKALKNVYKIPLESVGDPIYYKGDHVIPTVIYPNHIYTRKESFPWLINMEPQFRRTPIYY